jgi:hypothetical protein
VAWLFDRKSEYKREPYCIHWSHFARYDASITRYKAEKSLVQRLQLFMSILMRCQSTWRKLETPRHRKRPVGWPPRQKSAKAWKWGRDGVVGTSLHRPKFVHALTSGIQAGMNDQALRRAISSKSSHAAVAVALDKDDKLSNDTV